AGLPGPGLVAVYHQEGPYLRAPEREDEYGIAGPSPETSPYHMSFPVNYSALARIQPPNGVESVTRDITLDPGWTFTGKVLGPDGKPLAGARTFDLNGKRYWQPEPLKTAEFTAPFNPRRPHDLLFQHPEKKLIGVAQRPTKNGASVEVQMEPGAAV